MTRLRARLAMLSSVSDSCSPAQPMGGHTGLPKRLRHPVYIARADAISDFPTLAPTESDDARTLCASLDHEDRDPSAGLTRCIPFTRGVEHRQHPGPCPPSFARHVPAGALRCRDRGPGLRLRLLC